MILPQAVPEVMWYHWAVVFAGVCIGVGVVFEMILFSAAGQARREKVYTATNFWLILSGVLHCWIEFNMVFARNSSSLKPQMDMYAAADFRYASTNGMMEPGTAAMECITAVLVGPLCFLVAFAASHDFSWRHPLQIMLCTMQLYGLMWFVLQPIFSVEGIPGRFSSDPVLFWVIAIGCNMPWAVFPPILLYQSFVECCKVQK